MTGRSRRRTSLGGIPVIRGAALPVLGWHGQTPHLRRDRFQPPLPADLHFPRTGKPQTGGLWTSPVWRTHAGVIIGTQWTRHADDIFEHVMRAAQFLTIVRPRPTAKVLLIERQAHLEAAVCRWPDLRRDRDDEVDRWVLRLNEGRRAKRIDWPAAAREVDAVYLTEEGVEATKLDDPDRPNLWGWDVPTVLFLRPAFAVGRRIQVPSRDERVRIADESRRLQLVEVLQKALRGGGLSEQERATVQSLLDHVQAGDHGVALLDHLDVWADAQCAE